MIYTYEVNLSKWDHMGCFTERETGIVDGESISAAASVIEDKFGKHGIIRVVLEPWDNIVRPIDYDDLFARLKGEKREED